MGVLLEQEQANMADEHESKTNATSKRETDIASFSSSSDTARSTSAPHHALTKSWLDVTFE